MVWWLGLVFKCWLTLPSTPKSVQFLVLNAIAETVVSDKYVSIMAMYLN
mgnify:CR=1 FL=1